LVVVSAIVAVGFWPGRMNLDSITMIREAKSGDFTDQYAPLLQALWHPFISNGIGPGWVLFGQVLVFAIGAYLVLRSVAGPVAASAGSAFVVLTPTVFGPIALVGRDAWFLAALTFMFGATATANRTTARTRFAWIVAACAAGFIAMAARQNAVFAVAVAFVLLAAVATLPSASLPGFRWKGLAKVVGMGLLATALVAGTQAVAKRVIGVENVHPATPLYVYDLSAQSVQDGKNYIPKSVLPASEAKKIPSYFRTRDVYFMVVYPGAPFAKVYSKAFLDKHQADLAEAWRKRITSDPLSYLDARRRLFVREISVTAPTIFAYEPSIFPPTAGYSTTFPRANDWATDYMGVWHRDNLDGGIVFRVWPYLLVAIAAAVMLLWRPSWPRVILASMAIAALTHQVGLFFGLLGNAFRFEFPAVALVEIVVVACFTMLITRELRLRRSISSAGRVSP
jgi:hypothetical protein